MSGQQQQSFNDSYTALILGEAEKLYNKVTTKFVDSVIAAIRAASFSLPSSGNNNSQRLIYKNDTYDETEGSRYLNQQKIYNDDQEQPNETW